MSASSKAKAFGAGALVVWGVWQVAQSAAEDPTGPSRRTGSLVDFVDEQQDAVVDVVRDVRENSGDLADETVVPVVNGAARQAPQAADE